MPDDRAISVSPASTHGMPVAPSAARLCRLRRPIAIIAPQPVSPNTPAIRRQPLPPGQQRVHRAGQAGRRLRSGVGHGHREPAGQRREAGAGHAGVVHGEGEQEHGQVSRGLGGSGNVRLAVASIWARARHAARVSGTAAGSSASRRAGHERDPDHRAYLRFQEAEPAGRGGRLGPAVADHGQRGDLAALLDHRGDRLGGLLGGPGRVPAGDDQGAAGGDVAPGRADPARGAWRPCPRRAAARSPGCWCPRRRARPRSPAPGAASPAGAPTREGRRAARCRRRLVGCAISAFASLCPFCGRWPFVCRGLLRLVSGGRRAPSWAGPRGRRRAVPAARRWGRGRPRRSG